MAEKLSSNENEPEAKEPPAIEIVSGFDNKRTSEDNIYRQNIVKEIEKRRNVREKIKEGEIPYSGELSKLTDNERGGKREFQEGGVEIKTSEQKNIEEQPVQPEETPKIKEAPKLIIPEQYGEPRERFKSPRGDDRIDAEKREEEKRRQEEEKITRFPMEKREFQEGGVEIRTGEQIKKVEMEESWDVLASEDIMRRSPKEVVETFRNATENKRGEHRHLAQERNEMVRENLENGPVKMKIIRGREAIEQARQRLIDKEKKIIEAEEQSKAIVALLNRIPEKAKRKKEYMENGVFNSGKYVNLIREKLGVNENTFCKLVNEGYNVENAKVRPFWTTYFWGPEIKIPRIDNGKPLIGENKKEFKEREEVEQKFGEKMREAEIERWANGKIRDGRKHVILERHNCTKMIIKEAVEEHILEKEKKIEAEQMVKEEAKKKEEVKKPKIEVVTEIGREGTPEQMKKMKKIRKQIEADIEKKKKARKRMQDLIKKQKKGRPLNVKEVDYLNFLSEEERERAA